MKLLLDSVDKLTPKLIRGMADHEAAAGQAADEAVGGVRETSTRRVEVNRTSRRCIGWL